LRCERIVILRPPAHTHHCQNKTHEIEKFTRRPQSVDSRNSNLTCQATRECDRDIKYEPYPSPFMPGASSPRSRAPRLSGEIERRGSIRKRKPVISTHRACSTCRVHKVRCDAAWPRCSYCTSHNETCSFPPVSRRATCSQQ
jgi:hypothetical protein